MSLRYPDNDTELKTIVRGETSYDDTADELPETQLDTLVERAKAKLEITTGSSQWFTDDGLGFALAAYACMRAKAAVENVPLSGYSIGDERVSFDADDPSVSQQLQQWAEDVNDGLDYSNVDSSQGPTPTNTSGYIGESYIHEQDYPHDEERY